MEMLEKKQQTLSNRKQKRNPKILRKKLKLRLKKLFEIKIKPEYIKNGQYKCRKSSKGIKHTKIS